MLSTIAAPPDSYVIASEPGYAHIERPNAITCMCGEAEMLKVSDKGFWVRGVKVEQDEQEAQKVYEAFKAWMMWAQMTRDYK